MKPAIRVDGLSKCYRIGQRQHKHGYRTLRESLTDAVAAPFRRLWRSSSSPATENTRNDETLWALRDVSLDIAPGEVVGVIGGNGAGKSTFLKVLSRITEPTSGRVELRGRVGSLLEVGTGFHPELTGRENIYLNGAILGMGRREIDRKFDDIVAFAEVDRFLDTPVKRYSSGMYVRLAFAVASNLEPEILLVDEVLAVGDASFQKKCLGRMKEVARGGRTVVFVSHNMPAVQNLCSRCVLLESGCVETQGDPVSVIHAYNLRVLAGAQSTRDLLTHPGRTPGSTASMESVTVLAARKTDSLPIYINDDIELVVNFRAPQIMSDVTFGFVVKDELQSPVFGINTGVIPPDALDRPIRKRGTVNCRIPKLPLMPGLYSIDLYLGTGGVNFDVVYDAIQFDVQPADVFGTGKLPPMVAGNICWPAAWTITNEDDAA